VPRVIGDPPAAAAGAYAAAALANTFDVKKHCLGSRAGVTALPQGKPCTQTKRQKVKTKRLQ